MHELGVTNMYAGYCLVWPLLSSGSMKDHLPLLKETLQFMVQQLRGEDKLCLVTFDHEVSTHARIAVFSIGD